MSQTLSALARVDLNLLVVFQAIFDSGHATHAGRALGLSQPATSHALNRLRETLGDPLFVKTPRGMLPTARANTLIPSVREVLARLDAEVFRTEVRSLSEAARTFRVQTTDLIEALLIPSLSRDIERETPRTQISFTTTRLALPREEMENGAVDLAIAGFFGDLPPGFYRQTVFTDELCLGVRANHPRLGRAKSLSLKQFCAERHLIVAPGGELSGKIDRELKKRRLARQVSLGAGTFVAALHALESTDLLLVAPTRLFSQLGSGRKIRHFPLPVKLPDLQVVQVWHERNHRDPHHEWLRQRIRDSLK